MSLHNKIVLITGATGGLGPVVAERFYSEGCKLVLTDINKNNVSNLSEKLSKDTGNVVILQTDLTNEGDVSQLFRKATELFGGVSILCNVAGGYMDTKPFVDLSLDEWNTMMDSNLKSCFLTSREAIRKMKDKDYGRIINITAKPGLYPEAERGAYGIAKAGVAFLSRMLGTEYKKTGITINALAPSIIKTPANESWGQPEEMKNWVTPEELADMMVFLCQESSNGITGAVIEVFGGV
jgi:NAD(P)-dependent dehydrogenase (short-subunit alcohol dehydrogenase family)